MNTAKEVLIEYGLSTAPDRINKPTFMDFAAKNGIDSLFAEYEDDLFLPVSKNTAVAPFLADTSVRSPQNEAILSYAAILGCADYYSVICNTEADFTDMYVYMDCLRAKDPAKTPDERLVGACTPRPVLFRAFMQNYGKNPKIGEIREKIESCFPSLNFFPAELGTAMKEALNILNPKELNAEYFILATEREYKKRSLVHLGECGERLFENLINFEDSFPKADAKLRGKFYKGLCECPYLACSMSQGELVDVFPQLLEMGANIKKTAPKMLQR